MKQEKLKYRTRATPYGEASEVGAPPEIHQDLSLPEIEEDLKAQFTLAGRLRKLGAPPPATNHIYGWRELRVDENGWLWITYRPERPARPDPNSDAQTQSPQQHRENPWSRS